jgi:hypothetical protein
VFLADEAESTDSAPSVFSIAGFGHLESTLERKGYFLQPLFAKVDFAPSAFFATPTPPALPTGFCQVVAPDEELEEARRTIEQHPIVQAAYIKPVSTVPQLNTMMPSGPSALGNPTPDFRGMQGYLQPSPAGIDAMFAWTQAGGQGKDVTVIDLEWGWQFSHEDLQANSRGLLFGTNNWETNHGTAVIGTIGADDNGIGVTGICPEATMAAVSFNGVQTATAIATAASLVQAGDILLLEIHRAGPRYGFRERDDQRGYIAIEWWPDDFAAIRSAVSRGIIVVEAAGNGGANLDDALYNTPRPEFPPWWTNPFNRANRDSGAILVGAGAPPSGKFGPDRSRLDFSNFGSAIDAQGWGREVVSTGYGDLQAGTADRFYTARFSGTSSASPIVVGALACLQGVMRASGQLLTPNLARRILRITGALQQTSTAAASPMQERIGNRPDLRQAIDLFRRGRIGLSEPPI